MARIRWVEEGEATGAIAAADSARMAANPGRAEIPGILKCLSLSPDLFRGIDEVSGKIRVADAFGLEEPTA